MDRPFIPQTEAARHLEISVSSVKRLILGNLLSTDPRAPARVSSADVQTLQHQKTIPMPSVRPVLRVPMAPEKLGPGMYFLPDKHPGYITDTDQAVMSTGRPDLKADPANGTYYIGFLQVRDANAERLVAERGIVWATIAGWGNEAAEVLGLAQTIPNRRNRKVFTVRKLTGPELEPWRVYREKVGISPEFYT